MAETNLGRSRSKSNVSSTYLTIPLYSTRLPQNLMDEQSSPENTLRKIAADQIFQSLCTQKASKLPTSKFNQQWQIHIFRKKMESYSLKTEQWKLKQFE